MILLLFISRIYQISHRIKDPYGKLLSLGIFSLFIMQTIINVLMNLTLLPFTAVQLPFLSYGCEAFIGNMLLTGILLAVHRSRSQSNQTLNSPGDVKF